MSTETDKILAHYDKREKARLADRYAYTLPEVYFAQQERERAILRRFRVHEFLPVGGKTVLEVGCGAGTNLLDLIRFGFEPDKLVGVELIASRVSKARRNLPPAVNIIHGDAQSCTLPYNSFDLILQSTVFSSILDLATQQALANRMWNLTAPSGAILWYDFTFDNPRNSDVRGIPIRRIRQLFPAAKVYLSRVTLAPPIARRAARIHPLLYNVINAMPLLRTHVLCWIPKTDRGAKGPVSSRIK